MAHGQRGSAVVQALRPFSCAASPRGSARAACLLCPRLASDLLPLTRARFTGAAAASTRGRGERAKQEEAEAERKRIEAEEEAARLRKEEEEAERKLKEAEEHAERLRLEGLE